MGEAEPSPCSQLSAWVPSGYRPWLSFLAQVGALLSSGMGHLAPGSPEVQCPRMGWARSPLHCCPLPPHCLLLNVTRRH